MLIIVVLIFHRRLEPVLRVLIQRYAALVKAALTAWKISLYRKREKLVFTAQQKKRSVIVAKVIVCPLPKIRVRLGRDQDLIVWYPVFFRLSYPFELIYIHDTLRLFAQCRNRRRGGIIYMIHQKEYKVNSYKRSHGILHFTFPLSVPNYWISGMFVVEWWYDAYRYRYHSQAKAGFLWKWLPTLKKKTR